MAQVTKARARAGVVRAAVVAALTLAPRLGVAQGALLPVDDVAYTYIDALQARGLLRELPLVERPYTVGAVRQALATVRGGRDAARYARWVDAIDAAAAKYAPIAAGDALTLGVGGYAVAQTSGQRDLMRADDANALAPGVTLRALLEAGPVTAAMRAYGDRRLREDPDFLGKKDRVLAGRTEEAYLAASWRLGTVQLGRVARSWGLPGLLGLQLSPAPYSYDHLYARIGTQKVGLATVVARLDDDFATFDPRDTTRAQRWFSASRLALRFGSVDVGLTQSLVHGGAGRGFDLGLANPVSFLALSQYAENKQFNIAFGGDVLWRAPRGMLLGGQLLVDDFQIDDCALCGEPPSLGVALSAEGVPLAGGSRLFANYVRVTNLTYRAERRWESFTAAGVGLGQWASDFDELRVGIDAGPVLPLPVRGYVAYRRQGEGDYRRPYPAPSQWSTWPSFLEGTVIRTLRVGASGAWRVGGGFELQGDVGVNRLVNAGRVVGLRETALEGRVRLAWEPPRGRMRIGLD
jgi:hypothetical protein